MATETDLTGWHYITETGGSAWPKSLAQWRPRYLQRIEISFKYDKNSTRGDDTIVETRESTYTHKDGEGNPIYSITTTLKATAVVDEKGKVTTSFSKDILINDHNGHLTHFDEKDVPFQVGEKGSIQFQSAVADVKNFKTDNDGLSPSQDVANKRGAYQDAVSDFFFASGPASAMIKDHGTAAIGYVIGAGAEVGARLLNKDPEKIKFVYER